MPSYNTSDIRNIALVGQAGSGKTSLVEALLYGSGVIGSQGSIEKGDTVCDFDPLERRHHHSLNTAVVGLDHNGKRINIIDTPGYSDFLGQAFSALSAVETMAVVVNAQSGIEPMTRRMMEWAAEQHMCCMIIVNKIDTDPDHLAGIMRDIRETFGKECLALNLPAHHGDRVLDCYEHDSGDADFSSVADAHTALLEQVVEVDETLMERYLEGDDVSSEELHAPFEKALRDAHLIPVCFVSARTGTGIPELLNVLAELAPNPLEASPHAFIDEDKESKELLAEPDDDKPVLAHVFKVDFDPFVGKMALFRIHQGTVRKGSELLINDGSTSFKVAHLLHIQGKERLEIDEAGAGDICAVAKVDELHLDAILHDRHDQDHVHPSPLNLPTPVVGLALEPKRRGDEQKVSDVLNKITEEDPCLEIERDVSANETVLRGLGDFHLRVALEKMDDRYHVQVASRPPSIPYRETITRASQGHCRHKKQTGGAGQFGEVFIEVEPLPRGTGFEFVNRITGGAIPSQFIPAVEKGVRQVLESGAVAGYPMQDVRAIVYDGKFHSVDSKEIAFVVAGRKAFLDAVSKAAPIMLEPIVNIDVLAPEANMGDITGDIASRRGRINSSDMAGNGQLTVNARVPLSELSNYASVLKSITGGEGSYTLALSDYEPVPANMQQKLASEHQKGH